MFSILAVVLVAFSPSPVRAFGFHETLTVTTATPRDVFPDPFNANERLDLSRRSFREDDGVGGSGESGFRISSSSKQRNDRNRAVRACLIGAFVFAQVSSSSLQTATASFMMTDMANTAGISNASRNGASIEESLSTSSPSVFNHNYADPLHPECERKIQVNEDGLGFQYSGTAVGPKDDPVLRGCTPPEIKKYGTRRGAFDGKVLPGLKLDAGDGIHVGVWEPAVATNAAGHQRYEDLDGIRWDDGNKWIVQD
mmetsp:Transcript_26933/g.57684  ORF Transcript_26933/g.57684 Transcript_26933/m.57684 type:complete len:254 (+) Transcript_26933:257-1018(+)|eukprot:CAMPEP_0201125330 /NCGR_PEP_ID=MMETSP0850-20130426/20783_1 /ASSEMBLY_ACC=CAM_ASM_000622 /TAXON_ID=183588 /ORGANISM="Pseudo-nitzschia fraudulenta, Strain WWA7" /LENGTH=253 /DNA_ID=CAMNT_0047393297 /DNA_START=238 /DNA_END=999 /DNA_ORIENTATION=+